MSCGHFRTWSAPGNLLIAGEYLITETGGTGLALAVPPRARLRTESAPAGTVECRWAGKSDVTFFEEAGSGSLAGTVRKALERKSIAPDSRNCRLTIDTSEFFRQDGGKMGYGSSAVAALLMVQGMLPEESEYDAAQLAVDCHRLFQGGTGSGYDVLTSFHGGCGAFVGGLRPAWIPKSWPQDIKAWILSGGNAVDSGSSVKRYREWRSRHPSVSDDLCRETARRIEALVSGMHPGTNPDGYRFTAQLRELASLGIEMGTQTGVPARPRLPASLERRLNPTRREGIAAKCLGAGDEIIMLAAVAETLDRPDMELMNTLVQEGKARELTPDYHGLREDTE